MGKSKDTKRKAVLAQRALTESFKFQVWWGRNQKAQDIPDDSPFVLAELDTVFKAGLEQDFLTLREIIQNVERECGITAEGDRGTLRGSVVAFLLGITQTNPMDTGIVDMTLANPTNVNTPYQIEVFYDNEVRNQVIEWVKCHYDGVSTRLGQPVLKLGKSVIHFKRVIKQQI